MVVNNKRKVEDQPKLKLSYFNIKGKGEPIRLLCAYAGLELEDHRFASRQEFVDLKESGKIIFGQVPLLEVDGKHQLVQTAAILRYLSKLAKLYPENDLILAAKVDAALDQETDAFMGVTVATYHQRFGIPMDDELKEKSYTLMSDEILVRHLGNLEKLLKSSSTGWIAGTEEPSAADFAWFTRLADFLPAKAELSDKIKSLEDFPLCKTFVEKFKNLQAIQEYYAEAKK